MLASKAKRDAKVWRLHWWWAGGGGWSQFDRARDSSCEIVNYEIVLHTTDNEINNSEWKVSVLVQQPSPAQFIGVLPVKPVSNLTQLLTSRKQAADVDVCETCTNVDVWESWNVRVRSESHTGPMHNGGGWTLQTGPKLPSMVPEDTSGGGGLQQDHLSLALFLGYRGGLINDFLNRQICVQHLNFKWRFGVGWSHRANQQIIKYQNAALLLLYSSYLSNKSSIRAYKQPIKPREDPFLCFIHVLHQPPVWPGPPPPSCVNHPLGLFCIQLHISIFLPQGRVTVGGRWFSAQRRLSGVNSDLFGSDVDHLWEPEVTLRTLQALLPLPPQNVNIFIA